MHFNTVTAFATLASFAAIVKSAPLTVSRRTSYNSTNLADHKIHRGPYINMTVYSNETLPHAPVPVAVETSADPPAPYRMCPGGWTYVVEGACPSGFKGCTPDANSLCGPHLSFYGTCPDGLGQYYVCHNGFKGCSTNPSVCDLPGETTETAETPEAPNAAPEMPPSADPPAPYRMCPEDWTYVVEGACPSGFKGCVPDANSLCGPQQSFHGTCPESLGQYYVCSNGFKGCSTNPDVCSYTTTVEGPVETTDAAQPPVVVDTPADNNQCGGYPSTPSQPSNNTENATISNTEEGRPYSMCPEGHAYVVEGACPSGFLGCTADATTVCPPPRRFWGTCPTGHGNYYVCSNGFKGCSTNANVCDL